jgi:hypothetical protein
MRCIRVISADCWQPDYECFERDDALQIGSVVVTSHGDFLHHCQTNFFSFTAALVSFLRGAEHNTPSGSWLNFGSTKL